MGAPKTTGDLITAADWNALIGGGTEASVLTSETTASSSYGSLATVGPTVASLSTGTKALVGVSCRVSSATPGVRASMGFLVSGATTIAAHENMALQQEITTAGDFYSLTYVGLVTLTAGTNNFVGQYASLGAVGTAIFHFRRLWVIA